MSHKKDSTTFFGLMIEFDSPEKLLDAIKLARNAGYRCMDAYTPFPVPEIAEALELSNQGISLITLLSGITGGFIGYVMQWYANSIDYPINVGGHPYYSWPAYIPITFELTVLGASFGAALGMLGLNGLPKPYHPVFNHPSFSRASKDRYFLCVEARDPLFNLDSLRAVFSPTQALSAQEVWDED